MTSTETPKRKRNREPVASRGITQLPDELNPFIGKKNGPIPEPSEATLIRQSLEILQHKAVAAGARNPLVDLMIRLAKVIEAQ